MGSIKIINGALDEEAGDIVLRGRIDPSSFNELRTDDYQREILPLARITELAKAFDGGSVPDIDLSMRGARVREHADAFFLQDDVYIVDGLQRVTAAKLVVQKGGEPRLGATIHFGKTKEWERERFRILNVDRTRLSPNVLARNLRETNTAIDMLFRLTHDKDFVMCKRICWTQHQNRDQFLTAMTLLKVIGYMHGHLGAVRSVTLGELAPGLEKLMDRLGRNTFRGNIMSFFDIVDQAWGIRSVTFREGAVHLRFTFLRSLADLFSKHLDFWRDHKLFVEADLVRKLRAFPMTDPTVSQLSSASGKAHEMLFQLLLNHINSGKRTKRLRPRGRTSVTQASAA